MTRRCFRDVVFCRAGCAQQARIASATCSSGAPRPAASKFYERLTALVSSLMGAFAAIASRIAANVCIARRQGARHAPSVSPRFFIGPRLPLGQAGGIQSGASNPWISARSPVFMISLSSVKSTQGAGMAR